MLSPGQIIDRYEVEGVIGRGGTAVVYRVRHRQLNTLHALKVLSITSPAIRERMILEGRVQASLRHLNVVAVTDVLEVDGMPGLLLEHIEGPSLEDALRKYKLTVADAEVLFLGVLAGVRHAHHHGLVHRDLKPANVLLAQTPEGYVPKVTDFGLAKVLQGDAEAPSSTRTGTAMGTPHYMAPEQIRDARHVDQRADIFSLGCILYELVTGERAFPGEDALTVYNAVVSGNYIPTRHFVPDLPEPFDVAIRGSLVLDPRRRIPDCAKLLEVLRGVETWDPPELEKPPEAIPREATSETQKVLRSIPLAARVPSDGHTPPPVYRVLDLPSSPGDDPTAELEPTEQLEPRPAVDKSLSGEPTAEVERRPAQTTNWVALLLVAFVLVGFGVVSLAVVLSAGSGVVAVAAHSAGSPPDQVEPPPPKPTSEPVPKPAVEVPDTAVAVVDPVPAPVEVPAPKPVEKKTEPKPPAPKAPAPIPKPPVLVKLLSAPPNASVSVDGKPLAPTPQKVELTPGKHRVDLVSGEAKARFHIEVQESGDNKWCYDFAGEQLHSGSCPK